MADTDTTSVSDSIGDYEISLQHVPDEELYRMLEEMLRSNEMLRTETQMYEKFMKRVDPQLMTANLFSSSQPASQQTDMPVRGRKRSKSRSSAADRVLKLSAEQKCEIAQREIDELREEIRQLDEESEKLFDTYKAIMEEADIRVVETQKMTYEFDRDIVRGSVNTRTRTVMAEKIEKYFEDRLRQRDTLIEKLRLKNATLVVQRRKLKQQLKQKEEMGEVLHEVDFQQLKIENSQYLEKIEEKNQELLRLKQMAGKTLFVLNSRKKKMAQLSAESTRLQSEIAQRQELMRRVDTETSLVEMERVKAESGNRKLRDHLSDYQVPEVIEYVNTMAEIHELKKKENTWTRKVDIAKMAVNRHKKIWTQIRHGSLSAEI